MAYRWPITTPDPDFRRDDVDLREDFLLACVYILASERNGTLYVGVTSNLIKRVYEHKSKLVEGFTSRYNVDQLVWFEATDSIEAAITREKQIKEWKRAWKVDLIEQSNPYWNDLYADIV